MDWKIELVAIPVTDVDRAKAFHVEQVRFHSDHDHQVNDALRFVQLTPAWFSVLERPPARGDPSVLGDVS